MACLFGCLDICLSADLRMHIHIQITMAGRNIYLEKHTYQCSWIVTGTVNSGYGKVG